MEYGIPQWAQKKLDIFCILRVNSQHGLEEKFQLDL